MTLEDLAECEAEVIEPIKYEFKHTHGPDSGVTLWEVGLWRPNYGMRIEARLSVRPMARD